MTEPSAHDEAIGEVFQSRVNPWMQTCFGPEISADIVERGDRLLEEVLELLQTSGYDFGRVASLRDYVASRPVGEPSQEVGGVMVTLAAYCLAAGLDMHSAAETELARIWTKVEKIRAKQAAKPKYSPLPEIPKPDAVAKTAGLVDDDDLLRSVGLLFFDAMSVRCEPRSYARRCIQLVQERIAALHAPAPTAPEPPVWRHDFNAYVPVQRAGRSEADEAGLAGEFERAIHQHDSFDACLEGNPPPEATAIVLANFIMNNAPAILAALRAAEAQSELVEALRPFADIDGEGDEDFPDDEIVVVKFGRTTHYGVRLGDLRRARAALDTARGKS